MRSDKREDSLVLSEWPGRTAFVVTLAWVTTLLVSCAGTTTASHCGSPFTLRLHEKTTRLGSCSGRLSPDSSAEISVRTDEQFVVIANEGFRQPTSDNPKAVVRQGEEYRAVAAGVATLRVKTPYCGEGGRERECPVLKVVVSR